MSWIPEQSEMNVSLNVWDRVMPRLVQRALVVGLPLAPQGSRQVDRSRQPDRQADRLCPSSPGLVHVGSEGSHVGCGNLDPGCELAGELS